MRWPFYTSALGFALALLLATPTKLCGDDPNGGCQPSPSPSSLGKMPIDKFLETIKGVENGTYSHVVDALFMFDVRTNEKAVNVTAVGYDASKDPGNTGVAAVNNLYNALKDPANSGLDPSQVPQNTQAYIALLQSKASSMDLQQKFLLLSMLGGGLHDCYNHGDDPTIGAPPYRGTSQERIFNGIRNGVNDCGVCHDIHNYLVPLAKALGFVDVGTHSGLSDNESSGHSASHDIMHMRDPKTGLYYVQNYDHTIATNEKTLTRAIDVSTAVLGPLTGTSLIESKPGAVHIYQPRVTRWVRQVIEDGAKLGPDRSLITMHLGNREQTFRIEYGANDVKAFGLHSSYNTSSGTYTLDAIGLAGQVSGNKELHYKWLDEVGFSAGMYAGALDLHSPFVTSDTNINGGTGTAERKNLMGGIRAEGHARWNAITAKLEIRGDMMDFNPGSGGTKYIDFQLPPNHEISAGLTYGPSGSPLKIEAKRVFQISTISMVDQNPKLRTAYDKIDVVVDTRGGETKPYIVMNASMYLFEGAETWAAVGLKNHFKGIIPAGKAGTFYVVMDASAVVANRAKDPFYEAPLALSFGTGWTTRIAKTLDFGADLSVNNGSRPYFLFEEPGSVTPEMGHPDGVQVIGNVWLGGKF